MTGMYFEHYGVLGMKWGVRRTPAQLGHKVKLSPVESWKKKQTDKIDAMYAKTYRNLNKAEAANPGDATIAEYRKTLSKQHKADLNRIKSLGYMDIQEIQKKEKQARNAKIMKGVESVGSAAMWGARMSLLGLRIGGTVAVLNVIGDAGRTLFDYLNSPEGQETMRHGVEVINKVGNGELTALGLAKDFIVGKSPNSELGRQLSQLDVNSLKSGANYIPPDVLNAKINAGVSELKKRR